MMAGDGIQFYDFNLSAGGSYDLPATGAFYRVISSTGAVSIREDGGGKVGPIYAGQGMTNRNFNRLTIKDESGAANKGVLIVSGSDFVDDRITGEVLVIDGGKSRSIAGAALAGYVAQGGAASQYSQAQLWNKSAAKNIIVNSAAIFNGSQGIFNVSAYLSNSAIGAVVSGGANKKGGGAASGSVELRSALVGAGGGPLIGVILKTWWGPALGGAEWRMTEPIVVPPGYGLTLHHWTAACDLNASFEWFEENA